jgi:phosphatidylserine/phosphatidylglycerophosphate/cardiolipin synthase-like enzyme
MKHLEFVIDSDIYNQVVLDKIPKSKTFLWIATADLKDLYVKKGRKMVPFLEILATLVKSGVSIRLLHAKEPGEAFQKDFDKYPELLDGMERVCCPRVHFKSVIIDNKFAYSGSANLTGAGMGAKSKKRRNFESGFITTDTPLVQKIMDQFDTIWIGTYCPDCDRKKYCTEHELLIKG